MSHFETEESQEEPGQKEMDETAPTSPSNVEDSQSNQETEQDEADSTSLPTIFNYDQLRAKSENPVTGIDFKRREVSDVLSIVRKTYSYDFYFNLHCPPIQSQAYLSDEEFQTILGMTKEDFYELPRWKQDMHKKKADLF